MKKIISVAKPCRLYRCDKHIFRLGQSIYSKDKAGKVQYLATLPWPEPIYTKE